MAFDPLSTNGENTPAGDEAPLSRRLVWMFAYWAMGLIAVGAVGLFIRFWIKP